MQHVDHTLVLTVRNQPGVLVRIAHVFARRGCNIRSLRVEPHADEQWSTMTIIVRDVPRLDQMIHQLQKLIDVSTVKDHTAVQKN
ncbi:MAG TPA: acetolactate synthase small subunit [Verrucomicrobiae bacterium]|nr:acetolactate synthase small subunit [Verrucomicrobiae bacterium]